ncbi:hypothetical protein [Deinococcus sp.]|uniref:hypothetical protein n=1 Tax=Deinococcus sp. TaxID=47478 RepID=UPI003C7D39C8
MLTRSLPLLALTVVLAACGAAQQATAPAQPSTDEALMASVPQAAQQDVGLLMHQTGDLSDLSSASSQLGAQSAASRRTIFLRGRENLDKQEFTVPAYQGISGGKPYWFVITEASDPYVAQLLGVNYAPLLKNAIGTKATEKASFSYGFLQVPATVDFSPKNVVVPGPTLFPPTTAQPGSVGQAGYSPLLELPGGVVLNASHIGNASGLHDKVVSFWPEAHRVTLKETLGYLDGKNVRYFSMEASNSLPAALEDTTLAPALDSLPALADDAAVTARSPLAIFINGQTGRNNPERQGLFSALSGEGGPQNVIGSGPSEATYSPFWNLHVTQWTDAAVKAGLNVHQDTFETVAQLAADGTVTGPGGAAWGPNGLVVNCSVVSIDAP